MLHRNLVIFIAAGEQDEVNVRSASICLVRGFRLQVFYVRQRPQNFDKSIACVQFIRFLHNPRLFLRAPLLGYPFIGSMVEANQHLEPQRCHGISASLVVAELDLRHGGREQLNNGPYLTASQPLFWHISQQSDLPKKFHSINLR